MSNEFLVAFPIHPMELGRIYSKRDSLPFHCTLMHWFRLDSWLCVQGLLEELTDLACDAGQRLKLIVEGNSLFGPHNTVPVYVLTRTEELTLIHSKLFAFLARHQSLPEELRWVGAGWNPHVTIVNGIPDQSPGEHFSVQELVLVERAENGVKIVHSVIAF